MHGFLSKLPDNFRVLWSRVLDGAAALDEGVALEVGLEDEDKVPGRNDAAGTTLGRHLIRDGHFVVNFLKKKTKFIRKKSLAESVLSSMQECANISINFQFFSVQLMVHQFHLVF